MIMCDARASGITGEVADSYLISVEPRADGGAHVLWSDEPDQAMVFDDAAAAAEFCRDSPLEMFVVSFVPVSGSPSLARAPVAQHAESEADFLARLHQMVTEAEGRQEAGQALPASPPPGPEPGLRPPSEPDLSKPGALADELRRMGLM